jgi:hypothetical protein
MPEKQPKRPNNNAKALESWESEGGAPASDDGSTKRKRPRVLYQITKALATHDSQAKTEEDLEATSFALAHAAIREPAPAYNCGEPREILHCWVVLFRSVVPQNPHVTLGYYDEPVFWVFRHRTASNLSQCHHRAATLPGAGD